MDWLLVGKLPMWNSLMFSLYYQPTIFVIFYFVKVMRVDWLLVGKLPILCGIP